MKILTVFLFFLAAPAFAHCSSDNDGHRICRNVSMSHHHHLVWVKTAAGPVRVNPDIASRMKGFIRDVVARGFKGHVHCFSLSHRHVKNSLHFIGKACDFAQRGWNKTVRVMYHVRDLASKWGLRDGCTFRHPRGPDCGHIDAGLSTKSLRRVTLN